MQESTKDPPKGEALSQVEAQPLPTASVLFIYSPCWESTGVGAWTAPRNSLGIICSSCGCSAVGGYCSMLRRRRLGMVIVCGVGWYVGGHPFGLPTILRNISSYSLEHLPAFYEPWAITHLSHPPTWVWPPQSHILCRWRGQRRRSLYSCACLLSQHWKRRGSKGLRPNSVSSGEVGRMMERVLSDEGEEMILPPGSSMFYTDLVNVLFTAALP